MIMTSSPIENYEAHRSISWMMVNNIGLLKCQLSVRSDLLHQKIVHWHVNSVRCKSELKYTFTLWILQYIST